MSGTKVKRRRGYRRVKPQTRLELRAVVEDDWQESAGCAGADPAAWFPKPGVEAGPQVRATCVRCDVRRSCLAVALLGDEYGIWGGTTPDDRRVAYRHLKAGVPTGEVLDVLLEQAARPRDYTAVRRFSGRADITQDAA